MLRACALLLVALPALSSAAAAQTVVGHVVESPAGASVQGALVVLLDETGQVRGRVLSDLTGRFVLPAPAPGRYTVQAERIGLETTASPVLELAVGQVAPVTLVLATRALELEGIEVEGTRRCALRPDQGESVARLWDEARKALRNQELTADLRLVSFETVRYQRSLSPSGDVVLDEVRLPRERTWGIPIRSLPVEELLDSGFVRTGEDGDTHFFGPDAAVLLSEAFLDTHCFRLAGPAEGGAEPGLVGLAFEPVRTRQESDIAGTLWMDADDGRLTHIDFTYTWLPWEAGRRVARGRVEFSELAGGVWIVSGWWIRMPVMIRDLSLMTRGQDGWRVESLVEMGGEVLRADRQEPAVREAPDAPLARAALCPALSAGDDAAAVTGVVRRAGTRQPVAGARVTLSWTDYRVVGGRELEGDAMTREAITDAFGRYRVCGVPPGVRVRARARLGDAEGGSRFGEAPRADVLVLDLTVREEG